jgi:hypothetical protein
MNKALRVGRTPDMLIDILNGLKKANLQDKLMVVGTNALYAYETAASVRIEASQLATRDFDLLWDNRSKLSLAVQEGPLAEGMLGFLRRIDASFTLRDDKSTPPSISKDTKWIFFVEWGRVANLIQHAYRHLMMTFGRSKLRMRIGY